MKRTTCRRRCTEALSQDQVNALFEPLEGKFGTRATRMGTMLSLLFDVGLRSVEARHLRLSDLDFDPEGRPIAVNVGRSKTPAGIRRMPLPPRTARFVSLWLKARESVLQRYGRTSDWLLIRMIEKRWMDRDPMQRSSMVGDQLSYTNYLQTVKAHLRRCGVGWAATHTGRRTFATALARSESVRTNPVMAPLIVARALGHASPASSMPYLKCTQAEVDGAILAAANPTPPPPPPPPSKDEILVEKIKRLIADA